MVFRFILPLILFAAALGSLAFADSCGDPSASNRGGICYCPGEMSPLPPGMKCDVFAAYQANQRLGLIQLFNVNAPGCSSPEETGLLGCPTFLLDRAVRDAHIKKGVNDQCRPVLLLGTTGKDSFPTAADLESHFGENDATRLGGASHLASSETCMPKKVSYGANFGLSKTEFPLDEETKKAAITDYYYSMNRLKNGAKSMALNIASIDSVLEEPIRYKPKQCFPSSIPGLSQTCQQMEKCQPQGGLDNVTGDTIYTLKLLKTLKAQEKEATQSGDKAALKDISAKREALLDLVPWVKGDAFQKKYSQIEHLPDPPSDTIKGAIKDQLIQTRAKLSERLDSYKRASDCINTNQTDHCQDFSEVLESAPQFSGYREGDVQQLDANSRFAAADCRLKKRLEDQKTYEMKRDLAIGAALGVATLGAGWYISMGRGLMLGARALQTAGVAGRFDLATTTLQASNRMANVMGINDVYGSCGSDLEHLDTNDQASITDSCPKAASPSKASVTSNYRKCVVAAVLSGAGRVGAVKNGTRILAAAELKAGEKSVIPFLPVKSASDLKYVQPDQVQFGGENARAWAKLGEAFQSELKGLKSTGISEQRMPVTLSVTGSDGSTHTVNESLRGFTQNEAILGGSANKSELEGVVTSAVSPGFAIHEVKVGVMNKGVMEDITVYENKSLQSAVTDAYREKRLMRISTSFKDSEGELIEGESKNVAVTQLLPKGARQEVKLHGERAYTQDISTSSDFAKKVKTIEYKHVPKKLNFDQDRTPASIYEKIKDQGFFNHVPVDAITKEGQKISGEILDFSLNSSTDTLVLFNKKTGFHFIKLNELKAMETQNYSQYGADEALWVPVYERIN